jgi:hypothetical protein
MGERAIANPKAFVPELEEVDFDSLGLAVRVEGVDWGEASITPQMVKQAQGELSSSGHRQGVPIKIPIRVQEENDVPLAVAAYKLESIVTAWQEQGGFIERVFDSAAGFGGALCYRIIRHTTNLSGLQGWLFAHRRDAPDVVLTATRWPIGLSPEKFESEPVKVTGARQVVIDMEDLGGTVPGLMRWELENENESEDLRGLIFSAEHRDHPQDGSADTTASMWYPAKDLTPRGGGVVAEDEDGAEVVECPTLTTGWTTVLHSEISGVGHMTHVEPRRLMIDVFEPDTGDEVEWKSEWRQLGAARWSPTIEGSSRTISTVPVSRGYQLLDLGVPRPQVPPTGEHGWEFRLQARSVGPTDLRPWIRDVYVLSTEQWLRVANTSPDPIDGEPEQFPGTVEDVEGVGTIAWSSPGNAKAPDGACASCQAGEKEEPEMSHYLVAKDFNFDLPEWAIIKFIMFIVRRRPSPEAAAGDLVSDAHARVLKGGEVKTAVDLALPEDSFWTKEFTEITYGDESELWGQPWTAADINDGLGFAFAAWSILLQAGEFTTYGKPEVDSILARVGYSESSNPEAHVCYAQRKVELGPSGCYRQDSTTDAWGRIIEEGSPPVAPPGRLEGRAGRAIIIPSQGDFSARANAGSNDLTTRYSWHRGYLFAREAAS